MMTMFGKSVCYFLHEYGVTTGEFNIVYKIFKRGNVNC